MKLNTRFGAAALTLAMLTFTITTAPPSALAQQSGVTASASPKPAIIEWVYRTKYGYKDEWWRIFKKYQIAILERQNNLDISRNLLFTRLVSIPVKIPDGTIESSLSVLPRTRRRDSLNLKWRSSSFPIRRHLPVMRIGVGNSRPIIGISRSMRSSLTDQNEPSTSWTEDQNSGVVMIVFSS
jgi:hypothetical protein